MHAPPGGPQEGAQGQGLGKARVGGNDKPVQNHTEQGQIEGSVAVYIPFPAYLLGATFPPNQKIPPPGVQNKTSLWYVIKL